MAYNKKHKIFQFHVGYFTSLMIKENRTYQEKVIKTMELEFHIMAMKSIKTMFMIKVSILFNL